MAVVRMEKISILCHQTEREALIAEMQALGLFEVSHFTETHPEVDPSEFASGADDSPRELMDRLNRIRGAAEFLQHFRSPRRGLAKFGGERVEVKAEEYRRVTEGKAVDDCIEECHGLQRRRSLLQTDIDKLRHLKIALEPWRSIVLPLEEVRSTEHTAVRLGTIPTRDVPAVTTALPAEAHWESVQQDQVQTWFALLIHRQVADEVEAILKEVEIVDVSWPDLRGRPEALIEGIEADIRSREREIEEIEERASRLADQRPKLLLLIDCYANRVARKTILERLAFTSTTCLIEGWLKESDFDRTREHLESTFTTVSMLKVKPGGGETPPVAYRNRPWSKPFELVTDLYGRPKYTEIDPTPVLTPFFAIFFALCVTDAGYGLLLSLISLVALKKFRPAPGMKKLFQLLFLSGLLTIFAGIITGGYFGLDLKALNQNSLFVRMANSLKAFDPLENAMTFFSLVLACGVLHIFTGYLVKMAEGIRSGRPVQSLCVYLPWLAATLGLGLAMIGFISALPAWLTSLSMYLLLAGAAGIFLFQGIGSKSIIGYIGKGLGGLYGIIGIFGDILSYSRLLALGLATAVVAGVIDILGGMALKIPYIGILVTAIMMTVAHLVYLIISCLGAFVHTARLHFVEFFSKFYEGGGKPFEPFQENREHTIILTE